MNKKYMILPLMLVFLFATGMSLGQSANNTSITENNSTAAANIVSSKNVTAATNLKFIWLVTGIEADQIIMVLDQDGGDLFGQAKYEPQGGKPWNAEVTGSIANDKVDLIITAKKENELVSSKLSGFFDNQNESISGNYTQVSLGKIVNKGSFTALQISPDTSSYAPITIEEPKVETSAPAIVNTTATVATTVTTGISQYEQQYAPDGVGWVQGRVVDQTGAGIPSASITVDGLRTSDATDERGNYRLALSPGLHRIDPMKSGYGIPPRVVFISSRQTTNLDIIAKRTVALGGSFPQSYDTTK